MITPLAPRWVGFKIVCCLYLLQGNEARLTHCSVYSFLLYKYMVWSKIFFFLFLLFKICSKLSSKLRKTSGRWHTKVRLLRLLPPPHQRGSLHPPWSRSRAKSGKSASDPLPESYCYFYYYCYYYYYWCWFRCWCSCMVLHQPMFLFLSDPLALWSSPRPVGLSKMQPRPPHSFLPTSSPKQLL